MGWCCGLTDPPPHGLTNISSVDSPATYKSVPLNTSPPGEDSSAAMAGLLSPEYPVQATNSVRVCDQG